MTRRTILMLAFAALSLSAFGQDKTNNGVAAPESDSTLVQKKVAEWKDSLDNRNFSEDAAQIKKGAEQLGDKAKDVAKEYAPVVKDFVQSVVDYFKR